MVKYNQSNTDESTKIVQPANRDEIMSESYSRRSWKGIACAILVIAAMAAIIAVIVVYTGPLKPKQVPGTLALKDVIGGSYSAKYFNGTWISDTSFSYMDMETVLVYDAATLKPKILVPNETMLAIDVEGYKISPDQKYVLLSYNSSKVFRHSEEVQYKIYDVNTTNIMDLNDGKPMQYAAWGPKDSQLVFVFNNNIWYKASVEDEDVPIQVTNDGISGIVYNGIPDWVYEEEVLASESAIWWSPDGSMFSFIRFNDTDVPIMNYMKYGSFEDPKNVYPEVVQLRYPKPGRTNPTVTLFVVEVSNSSKPKEITPPDEIKKDYYISAVTWANSKSLCVTWVPRIQNKSLVTLCDPTRLNCVKNSQEESKGWVDSGTSPLFSDDGHLYFLIQAFEGNYRHLAMYTVEDGKATFLTNGTYEVTKILFFKEDIVYYIRTEPDNPGSRQIASVNIGKPMIEHCLTCDLDLSCKSFGASFSTNGTYFVLMCMGGTTLDVIPYTEIRKLPENRMVIRLQSNEVLKERLANQTLCDFKFLSVPVGGGYDAFVRLYLPKDFDETKAYPLLISVYGGPGTQAVANTFTINFGTYMSTVRKYIYAEIDGRGSAFRGNKLMFEMYKRLGTVEIEDQISVAKYLGSLRYIDANRMAIWGWSYGGYAAGMALVTGLDTFKCGLSVAPVTSWYYYDTIYTERYMLTPEENLEAYNSSDLMKRASMFLNKKYLLIHGTGDDNVHVQQSMMLMKALNKAGVLFDSHLFPDEAHSISDSTLLVYRSLEQFVQECFA